jgi:hypothetical protein
MEITAMSKVLRFAWATAPTTTAMHMATYLLPTNDYTRKFVEKAIGPMAGVYGFDASYLGEKKEFKNQSITVRKG